jgi:LPS export ABC transporter protein LptC
VSGARSVRSSAAVAAALALGLALGCSNGKQPPLAVQNPLADSADQVLYHTKSILTDAGVMKAEVYGDTAYVFDDNTRVEMQGVRTIFFTVTGERNAVLTSREGTYNTRTNNMEARDDVVVVSVDGRRLTTPVLKYSQARNEISSDTSFSLTDSNATRTMIGIGFTSDPDMNNMRCLRACSGAAGVVTLPSGSADTTRASPAPPPGSTGRAPNAGSAQPGVPPGAGAATRPGASTRAAATGKATGQLPPGMPGSAAPSTAAHPSTSAAPNHP